MTEKDSIKIILERRGIINNGVFDELRFRKLVTEPWIYAKTIKYGFDKMNENTQVVDNEPVIEEVVEIQEPITVVEEPLVAEEVVETSTESVLLEEDVEISTEFVLMEEEIEEPVVEAVEEPIVEVVEEVVETPKKKTSKKK